MKERLNRLKKYFYERLPLAAKKKVKGFPDIRNFEFILKAVDPKKADIRKIREIILLNPFTIATHPVVVRLIGQKNEASDLEVLFSALNPTHGKKIEELIRSMLKSSASTVGRR